LPDWLGERAFAPSPLDGEQQRGGAESPLARAVRAESTDAEQRLWHNLRAHRMMGAKFRRQHPIGPYIVDFVCFESRLIIEVDGGQHQESAAYDHKRDRLLRSHGFLVLRFWDSDVLLRTKDVLEEIYDVAQRR
jgi:very-short-patch-repair endonuclease